MCQCTPEIRTPFCGKGKCKWPEKDFTFNTTVFNQTVEDMWRSYSEHKEVKILSQLEEFVKRDLLVVEETEPVITQSSEGL